ncbi:MAG TPA: hypothetical protein VHW09_10400 [Bryobacteraceae bacterium]|jgi:hypothetical protein|nr:hypothetical protein [Bryobacteraceae bacterium]
MGDSAADTIINGLDKAWAIVKDNKPDSSAKTSFCQAIPGKIPFNELYGWKNESMPFSYELKNKLGITVIDVQLQLDCLWYGQSTKARGLFLNNFNVWCKSCDVEWGWTLNIDATVSGNAFNSGSKDAPVGAIPLIVSVQAKTMLINTTKSWKFTCHGNGARDVA